MIGHYYLNAEKIEYLTAHFTERFVRLQQVRTSDPSQTQNDLRLNKRYLFPEIRLTCFNLVRLRIAIVRRTRFQNIGDVDILALKLDRFEHLRKQLPRTSDKWNPLLIFISTGCLTNDHQFCIRITNTEYEFLTQRS